MELRRIGIIGHFCINGNRMDGQTVKTREINDYLEKNFEKETLKFDTYKNSRNPIKIVKNTYKVIKNSKNVILIVSSRGYKILLPIINFFNIFYKRKIFDFVIGGNRYKIFDKSKFLKKEAKKVNKIYVESNKIKQEYEKRDIHNVEIIPNFKNIKPIDEKEIKKNIKKEKIKLCTFSRVHLAKGIEDSIETVKLANTILGKNIFELDIYGEIDEKYKEKFDKIKDNLPNYITYKGCVNSNNATEILKQYDLMLFLTYWMGEGFPGTIIDAFNSALPVIATDWNYNFDILEDNRTGIKVPLKQPKEVAKKLIELYENQGEIVKMKYECLKESKKYNPKEAMKKFIVEIE